MKFKKLVYIPALWVLAAKAQTLVVPAVPPPPAANLLAVHRIYVEQLTGGPTADALRDLLIASLDSTKLFVLTDNPDRADAVLRGAADDHAFTDTFDSNESLSTRTNGGKSGSGSSSY